MFFTHSIRIRNENGMKGTQFINLCHIYIKNFKRNRVQFGKLNSNIHNIVIIILYITNIKIIISNNYVEKYFSVSE